jgi:predicted RNase H-like HicB family nuclease
MTKRFSVIIERDREGYYVASVPAIQGCHTQAKSLDELVKRIREAIELCLEVEGKDIEPLDFVGVQEVSVNL